MRIEIRSHRSWYGRKRHRWYLVSGNGRVICFGSRSYSHSQGAWEEAEWTFSTGVTMVYDDPDEGFEQYAGPRDWE